MARYSAFLGRFVDVQYRAGDICLPASGTFVGDSGRSIFLEQHYEQHGQPKNFRWEIPYQCIVRLEEAEVSIEPLPANSLPSANSPAQENAQENTRTREQTLQANAAHASGGSMFPISGSPKTA